MNNEIEFTRFACSRSKFAIFSLKMSLLNKPPSSTSCLPTDPTCIFSFLVLVTKKVEKIRTKSRKERHTENLFLGLYN